MAVLKYPIKHPGWFLVGNGVQILTNRGQFRPPGFIARRIAKLLGLDWIEKEYETTAVMSVPDTAKVETRTAASGHHD